MAVIYDPLTGLPKQQQQQQSNGVDFTSPYTAPGPVSFVTGTAGGSNVTGTATAPGQTTGGNTFQQFLENDPFWKQLNADLSAQGIADEAAAKAQTQRALIQFGEVPDNLTGLAAQWLDPTTRQLAQQNTTAGLSTSARLAKMNSDAIRQIRNTLAARGALQSGEFGHQLKENQSAFERAQYDAREQLTNALSQIQSAYAAGQRAAAAARTQGMGQVVQNYYGQPPPAPPAPPTSGSAPPGYPEVPATYSNPDYANGVPASYNDSLARLRADWANERKLFYNG